MPDNHRTLAGHAPRKITCGDTAEIRRCPAIANTLSNTCYGSRASAQFRPILAGLGHCLANSGHLAKAHRPTLAICCQTLPNSDQIPTNIGRFWPMFARMGPNVTKFDPTWPILGTCWSNWALVGQTRQNLAKIGQSGPTSTRMRLKSADLAELSQALAKTWPRSAQFWAESRLQSNLWTTLRAPFGQLRNSPGSPWATFRGVSGGAVYATVAHHRSGAMPKRTLGMQTTSCLRPQFCRLRPKFVEQRRNWPKGDRLRLSSGLSTIIGQIWAELE